MSYDWRSNWDEHTITGFSAPSGWWNSVEQWATWATDIDIRIDVEQIMRKLAEKYVDSFKHLVALYAVTTQVTRKDAEALAGVTPGTGTRLTKNQCFRRFDTSLHRCFWNGTPIRCQRSSPPRIGTMGSSPRHIRTGVSSISKVVPSQPLLCWSSTATPFASPERSERKSTARPTARRRLTSDAIHAHSRST